MPAVYLHHAVTVLGLIDDSNRTTVLQESRLIVKELCISQCDRNLPGFWWYDVWVVAERRTPHVCTGIMHPIVTKTAIIDPLNVEFQQQLIAAGKWVKSNIRTLQQVRWRKLLNEHDNKGAWKFIQEVTYTTQKDSPTCIDPILVNEFFATSVKSLSSEPRQVPVTLWYA